MASTGKVQRDPTSGKLFRDPATGKINRGTDANNQCCCGGCQFCGLGCVVAVLSGTNVGPWALGSYTVPYLNFDVPNQRCRFQRNCFPLGTSNQVIAISIGSLGGNLTLSNYQFGTTFFGPQPATETITGTGCDRHFHCPNPGGPIVDIYTNIGCPPPPDACAATLP